MIILSVWDIQLESEDITFGNALVSLYIIKSDTVIADRGCNHAHSYYELHLVTKGMHTYTVDGKDIPVHAGEMLIIQPKAIHKAVRPKSGLSICVLSLSLRKRSEGEPIFPQLLQSLDAAAGKPIPLDHAFSASIIAYSNSLEISRITDLLHRKLAACQIIVGILDRVGCDGTNDRNIPQADFDIILETLVCNSDVSLSEIAKRLGYSQRQISRKIKSRYGKTFSQLRKETL